MTAGSPPRSGFTTAPGAPAPAPIVHDPLRYCIFTTVALLAWLVGPPAIVMAMSALGIAAYVRAMRGGLTRTKCVLRRPWLAVAYLAAAFCAGAWMLVRQAMQ